MRDQLVRRSFDSWHAICLTSGRSWLARLDGHEAATSVQNVHLMRNVQS